MYVNVHHLRFLCASAFRPVARLALKAYVDYYSSLFCSSRRSTKGGRRIEAQEARAELLKKEGRKANDSGSVE